MASIIQMSTQNGKKSNLFIIENYDQTTHFESTSNDALSILKNTWRRV